MGQRYNYVVDNKLAELEGFKDARDYFSQNLRDVSQASLTTYARALGGNGAHAGGASCV